MWSLRRNNTLTKIFQLTSPKISKIFFDIFNKGILTVKKIWLRYWIFRWIFGRSENLFVWTFLWYDSFTTPENNKQHRHHIRTTTNKKHTNHHTNFSKPMAKVARVPHGSPPPRSPPRKRGANDDGKKMTKRKKKNCSDATEGDKATGDNIDKQANSDDGGNTTKKTQARREAMLTTTKPR